LIDILKIQLKHVVTCPFLREWEMKLWSDGFSTLVPKRAKPSFIVAWKATKTTFWARRCVKQLAQVDYLTIITLLRMENVCNFTVVKEKNPCSVPIDNNYIYCSPVSMNCPIGQWCHLGDGPETSVCCPESSNFINPVSFETHFKGLNTF